MKKRALFLATLCTFFLLFSGCGKKVTLDLEKVSTNLETITTDTFYLQGAALVIEEKEFFSDLEDIYDYDFEKIFDLDKDLIQEYSVRMNKKTKEMYLLLLPIEGKKEDVKDTMDDYFKSLEKKEKDDTLDMIKDRLEEEIDDYLIYIVSKDTNENIFNSIKDLRVPLFGGLMQIDDEFLRTQFDINPTDLDSYLIAIPNMMTQTSGYYILKPASGKEKDVKEKMTTYMTNLEEQWKTYLPDQYELVKNRKEITYGDYLIYIISSDNDKVFEEIKKAEI